MDYKVILNLMKEMNNTDLTKLEIEEEGLRICMEKGAPAPVITMAQQPIPQMASIPVPVPSVPQPQAAAPTAPAEKPEEISGKRVLSPMVGTFYSQAAPEKPAFVKVGDKVKKGQTLCIIEAMKLLNEIESEFDGEVVKILAQNEQMVEFGQPLFVIQ